jgi:hypothetical protein
MVISGNSEITNPDINSAKLNCAGDLPEKVKNVTFGSLMQRARRCMLSANSKTMMLVNA